MLTEKHIRGIEARHLDPELAIRMGLYSGQRMPDGSVVPDPGGDILCFPFIERGVEVNTKYRFKRHDGQRGFGQRKDAVKTAFNIDCLLDDAVDLETDVDSLVWTEGEFDCIAAVQCGFPYAVSVPDGAVADRDQFGRPLPPVPNDTRDIDPEKDDKFSFFSRLYDHLSKVRTHIIATDNDGPGKRMAQEMARRLGQARCAFVVYPTEPVVPDRKAAAGADGEQPLRPCKDLNEVLQFFGPDYARAMLGDAKPWPVRGLYKLSDYPDRDPVVSFETGISPEMDEHFRLYEGAFIVCTGYPGSGKSTVVNQVAVAMAKNHGWPVTIFSGEMDTKPYLETPLKTAYLDKERKHWSRDDKVRAEAFMDRLFSFIDYNVRPDEEEAEIDVDFIIQKAIDAVFRYGTKLLIIDPWNELEHFNRPMNVSLTEYVGKCIRKLKRFAKVYRCAVIVVAHPAKPGAGAGRPGLYSISDSANWANKAELGLIVWEEEEGSTKRMVWIPKRKFKGTGKVGECYLDFDPETELYRRARPDPMAH